MCSRTAWIIKHKCTVIRKYYDGSLWTLFWICLGKYPIKITALDILGNCSLLTPWEGTFSGTPSENELHKIPHNSSPY